MIEVNLLPGGGKRFRKGKRSGGGLKLKVPSFSSLPVDRWILGSASLTIVVLALVAWLFMGIRSQRAEAQVALDEAQRDSARFSDLIARTQLLTARRDSIGVRVGIIQKIDQDRFIWAHVMDEVARALPDYTWLAEMSQVSTDPITVRLAGQAGNNFALTVFMEQLEASPFLQGVTLIQSSQEVVGQGGPTQQTVQGFQLEVTYVQPPMDFLQTVPLFEGAGESQTQKPDSARGGAAPDSVTHAPSGRN